MPFSVACDACGASFKLPEEIYERRVAGRLVSLKCKKCKASITVDGTKPRTDLPEAGDDDTSEPSESPPAAAVTGTPGAQPAPSIAEAPHSPAGAPEPGARRPLFSEGPAADWEIPESLRPPKPDPLPKLNVPAVAAPPLDLSPPVVSAPLPPSPPAPEVAAAPPAAAPLAPPAAAAPLQNGQTQESKARPAGAMLSSSAMRPKLESSPQTPRAKQESLPLAARAKQESSPQVGRAKQESALAARLKAEPKTEPTPPTPRVKLESAPIVPRAKQEPTPIVPRAKQEPAPIAPRAKQESAPIVPRAKQESSPQVPRAKQESAARGKLESSPQVPRLKAQANSAPRAKQDSTPQARAEAGAPLKAKAPPLPQKDLTPQAAPTAKMPPAKPARSPLALRAAPVWEPEDDALTVPMPPVDEALTRPLPPVMSRTPTLPGIPDTFRVGERGGAAPAENLWAVSYADDDDRELTTEELLEELRAGVLDAETLVWRQNMADWCALGDVPELARHLTWKREQPPKGEGFQVAEPERGLLYPTAYYPPPPEEEEDDKTAVFAYDAALLAAATSEYPAPPPKPPAMPAMPPMPPPPAIPAPPAAMPDRAAPTQIGPPAVAWPPVAPAVPVAAPVPHQPAPAASPAHSAADRASSPPPKFKRRGGALAIMALLVVAGLGGLAWILIRSSKPPVVAAGPERKVETPRAILPPEEKVEDKPKPAEVDPYAVPAASASASAPVPAGSAAGDFFELFASGAQSTSQQDFDKTRAEKALAALAARAANCRKTGDPPGMASVVVRFDPTGHIGDVRVIGKPYADTGTARCIITRFLGARVQAFKGEPQTLVKNFMLY
jgi:hypothetical protein